MARELLAVAIVSILSRMLASPLLTHASPAAILHPPPPASSPTTSEDTRLLLAAINRIRKTAGAPPLCPSQELTAMACEWIANLATAGIKSCDGEARRGRGDESSRGGSSGGSGGGNSVSGSGSGSSGGISGQMSEFAWEVKQALVAVTHASSQNCFKPPLLPAAVAAAASGGDEPKAQLQSNDFPSSNTVSPLPSSSAAAAAEGASAHYETQGAATAPAAISVTPLLTAASRPAKQSVPRQQQARESLTARSSRLRALVHVLAASQRTGLQSLKMGSPGTTFGRDAPPAIGNPAAATLAGSDTGSAAVSKDGHSSGLRDGVKSGGGVGAGSARARSDDIGRYSWRYVGICSSKEWVAALLVDGSSGNQQQQRSSSGGGFSCWVEEEWGEVPNGYAIPV